MPLSVYLSRHVWLGRGATACLLWPLTLLSRVWLIVSAVLTKLGVRPATRLPVPVLVVGNVVAGGTGKTPVVISLVEFFKASGWQPGVIARAYGTDSEPVREVQTDSPAQESGDEPLLIKQRCNVPVFTGRERSKAAQALLQAYPHTRLIISDDGLQHHALMHDMAICVFDDRGLGNGWLLPAGPLREPWPRLPQPGVVQYVLHTGKQPFENSLAAKRQLSLSARNALGEQRPLSNWQDCQVQALAAIAQPHVFFAALEKAGLHLQQTHVFADHADLSQWIPADDAPVFCTEKDAVKLWPHLPQVWAVPLDCTLPALWLDQLLADVQRLSLVHGQKTS